jgi:hypothetical protein
MDDVNLQRWLAEVRFPRAHIPGGLARLDELLVAHLAQSFPVRFYGVILMADGLHKLSSNLFPLFRKSQPHRHLI